MVLQVLWQDSPPFCCAVQLRVAQLVSKTWRASVQDVVLRDTASSRPERRAGQLFHMLLTSCT